MSLLSEFSSGLSSLFNAYRSRMRLTMALRVLVHGDGLGDIPSRIASLDIDDIASNTSDSSNGFKKLGGTFVCFSGVRCSSILENISVKSPVGVHPESSDADISC